MSLYKGGLYFEGAAPLSAQGDMPFSLYTDDASMEALGNFDHGHAEGFLSVLGVSARNVGKIQFRAYSRSSASKSG